MFTIQHKKIKIKNLFILKQKKKKALSKNSLSKIFYMDMFKLGNFYWIIFYQS